MWRVLVVVLAACSRDPSARMPSADSVWPDTLKPIPPASPRLLVYQPANLTGYALHVTFQARVGSQAQITLTTASTVHLVAGATPNTRGVVVDTIDSDALINGRHGIVHIDHERATVDDGRGPKPMPGANPTTEPMFSLVFETSHVTMANKSSSIAASTVGTGLDDLTSVFPDLPAQPISAGFTWTTTKELALGQQYGQVMVTYRLTYQGDTPCPRHPTKTCAHLEIHGRSGGKYAAAYVGKLLFDLEGGIVEETRLRTAANVESEGRDVELDGTVLITTVAR